MKKIIAKTLEGREFIYSKNSAHAVPNASAAEICAALNANRYQLKDGEKWHIYEAGWYELEHTAAAWQSFGKRNGSIYERR